MYIDKDAGGRITISEMTPREATIIQIAMLALADQQPDSENSPILRRAAMTLDKVLQQ